MLIVGTTNVADGNTSPFEYNDETSEIAFLDNTFTAILKTLVKDNKGSVDATYTNVNRLSKDYQDERYSPLYNLLTEPLVLAKKTPSLLSFKRKWMANHRALLAADPGLEAFQYQKSKLDAAKKGDRAIMKATLAALVVFDYAMVLTMRALRDAVGVGGRKSLRGFHESAAAIRTNKKQMLCDFLKSNAVDVFMVQEVQGTTKQWNAVLGKGGHQIVLNLAGNTGIIVSKADAAKYERVDFPVTDTKLHDEILVLKTREVADSKAAGIDTYYISAHLNSKDAKKAGTPKNYEDQWALLCKWIKALPKKAKYVLGIDANHHPDFANASVSNTMHAFPADASTSTTRKQRTSMQAQQHKIAKLDEGCKDHVVTNKRIRQGGVRMLTAGGDTSRLLPNAEHPCDHFISLAKL
jgi:hypothetical protein